MRIGRLQVSYLGDRFLVNRTDALMAAWILAHRACVF